MASYERAGVRRYFRADAAFAKPEVYEYLEEHGCPTRSGSPATTYWHGEIQHLMKRPVGRLPRKPVVKYHDFSYQAGSWDRPRRVVAKVEWHRGELYPRVGFGRHQHVRPTGGGGAFLQRARNGRAVDQGGEVRPQLGHGSLATGSWPTR